ncbi:nucleotidyltransferase family protein [soil metagenome]
MLFAAGLGTRLRPLTDHTPKALIDVGGVPMLEHVARRLVAAGADRLVINTFHLADQVERFVEERNGFGVETRISREEGEILDTGGGLLQAAPHFRQSAPFFVHNADILTDLPLGEMYQAHSRQAPLATLAVMQRSTGRRLLFDSEGLLGRVDDDKGLRIQVREAVGPVEELAFSGIHVVSPDIFGLMTERGVFSILDPYLRLAGEGHTIRPFRIDGCMWLDIGKPEQLEVARTLMRRNKE